MSQGAWHLCPLLVTSFQLTKTGIMLQVPVRARKKKRVTVGDSPLPGSFSSASVCLSNEAGNSDFSLSSGSLLGMVQNRADGLSFDSYLLRIQTLPPTHLLFHRCVSILSSLTPTSHENHVYFWKPLREACLGDSTCHGSLSWP